MFRALARKLSIYTYVTVSRRDIITLAAARTPKIQSSFTIAFNCTRYANAASLHDHINSSKLFKPIDFKQQTS